MIYSVDMVKLRVYVSENKLTCDTGLGLMTDMENFVCNLIGYSDYVNMDRKYYEYKAWQDNRINRYKYNVSFELADGNGFYVGFVQNAEKDGKKSLVIRFNPNKIDYYEEIPFMEHPLRKIITKHYRSQKIIELMEFDLAIDIQCRIENLIVKKPDRIRTYNHAVYKGVETYYFGERGTEQIKVYDKAQELGLGKEFPLTRIEYTIKQPKRLVNGYNLHYDYKIIDIYATGQNIGKQLTFEEKVDKTANALYYAVLHGYNVNELTRTYKRKVSSMLENSRVQIDFREMDKKINEYLVKINLLEVVA